MDEPEDAFHDHYGRHIGYCNACGEEAAERLKEGSRLYAEGMSMHEVAEALSMSYSGVQKMLAQAGVERRPQGRTKRGAA